MIIPRLLVSAAHKSSGKTTVSVGLCAALRRCGHAIQPFKKGPDYIDPIWLSAAAGRACRNLDPYLMTQREIASLFVRHVCDAGIALVEGNMGLHDGMALDGSDSNAALAKILGLPVILVIDARGMTRGIAPLILGYQAFEPDVRIAGVILNNLAGARHEAKLRAVIERYTGVPVVGAIARDALIEIEERHLGLIPGSELPDAEARIAALAERVGACVDLERVIAIASSAAAIADTRQIPAVSQRKTRKVRIGIARDRAFGFYYPDDFDALRAAGAEIVTIDTLRQSHLPAIDGLFIGGGFPELFMDELEANVSLRTEVRAAIESGLPAYAECAGLMYLARSLTWKGRTCSMVGAIEGDAVMHERPVGRGYVELAETAQHPWPTRDGNPFRAHEFHHSSLENIGPECRFAYRVIRGHGIDGVHDGIVQRNLLASYSHLRSLESNNWAERFVAHVARCAAASSTIDNAWACETAGVAA